MGSKTRHSSYQTDFVKIDSFFFKAERQKEKILHMNVCVCTYIASFRHELG